MKPEKKIELQQKQIENLEKNIQKLERENQFLNQLFPDCDKNDQANELLTRLRQTLGEALASKEQYDAAVKEMRILKQSYKAEMDALLSRIRKDTRTH